MRVSLQVSIIEKGKPESLLLTLIRVSASYAYRILRQVMGKGLPAPATSIKPCAACGGDGLVAPGDYLDERRPEMPPRKCALCGGRVWSGIRPQPETGNYGSKAEALIQHNRPLLSKGLITPEEFRDATLAPPPPPPERDIHWPSKGLKNNSGYNLPPLDARPERKSLWERFRERCPRL